MSVTLDDVKRHLRLSLVATNQDELLSVYLNAAVEVAEHYCGVSQTDLIASDSGLPLAFKAGVLILVSDLYENRESNVMAVSISNIPMKVETLLDTLSINHV